MLESRPESIKESWDDPDLEPRLELMEELWPDLKENE